MRTNLLKISVLGAALGMMHCGSSSDSGDNGGAPGAGTSGATPVGAAGSAVTSAGGALVSAGSTGVAGAFPVAGGNAGGGTGAAGSPGTGGTGGTASGGHSSTGGAGSGTGGVTGASGAGMGGSSGGKGGTSGTGGTSSGGKGGAGGMSGTAGSSGTAGTGGSSNACIQGTTHSGGTQYCANKTGNLSGGYSFQLWSSGTGTGCMTPYGADAAFKANWSNVGDFLARVGLGWNSTQTYDQLGTIASDFAYTKTGSGGGFSFIGIYGWSESPLVEYYIVEDWYGNGIPTGGGTLKGTFSVDGGTYNVYTHTQTNQPAITGGNATFPQFFSIRQTPRQCGHISISEHFKKWASFGMTLGKMEEARILVEVGGGTGSIDFTTATLTAK